MLEEIYALAMRYAIATQSPQRPLPLPEPKNKAIGLHSKVARRDEIETIETNPSRMKLPRLDERIYGPERGHPNYRVQMKITSSARYHGIHRFDRLIYA